MTDLQRPMLLGIAMAACMGYVAAGAAPGADARGGDGTMLQDAPREPFPDEAGGPAGGGVDEVALRQEMREVIRRHKRELLPEYERRVREDGQASADAWLRARVHALGRQEGERIRGKYGEQGDG